MIERIIAVHLHDGRHFYFGSKKAIFDVFDAKTIGCTLATLYRAKLEENGPLRTKRATIESNFIYRTKQNRK